MIIVLSSDRHIIVTYTGVKPISYNLFKFCAGFYFSTLLHVLNKIRFYSLILEITVSLDRLVFRRSILSSVSVISEIIKRLCVYISPPTVLVADAI